MQKSDGFDFSSSNRGRWKVEEKGNTTDVSFFHGKGLAQLDFYAHIAWRSLM